MVNEKKRTDNIFEENKIKEYYLYKKTKRGLVKEIAVFETKPREDWTTKQIRLRYSWIKPMTTFSDMFDKDDIIAYLCAWIDLNPDDDLSWLEEIKNKEYRSKIKKIAAENKKIADKVKNKRYFCDKCGNEVKVQKAQGYLYYKCRKCEWSDLI